MGKLFGVGIVIFLGVVAWNVGEKLSADAISLAVGVMLGVFAGIPVALLVLAGQRTTSSHRGYDPPPPQPHAPTVIVLGGGRPQARDLPHWRVIGDESPTYDPATYAEQEGRIWRD